MNERQEKFESWMVIELFGHQTIAGFVTEQTVGGCSFIRVDVPKVNGHPGFTRLFGNGAIYSMMPTTEEVVRRAVEYHHPRPLSIYIPPARQIAALDEVYKSPDDDYENGEDDET